MPTLRGLIQHRAKSKRSVRSRSTKLTFWSFFGGVPTRFLICRNSCLDWTFRDRPPPQTVPNSAISTVLHISDTSSLKTLAPPQPVERDGRDDYDADDDVLARVGNTGMNTSVLENLHDQAANQCSHDGPLAAAQTAAADDDRGDHLQLESAGRWYDDGGRKALAAMNLQPAALYRARGIFCAFRDSVSWYPLRHGTRRFPTSRKTSHDRSSPVRARR
jgi:hypothetical protein